MNLVLMRVNEYWGQVLTLPKAVLKKINVVCMDFLWSGQYDSNKPGYAAWDRVCEHNGGALGVRNIKLWNRAAMGSKYGMLRKLITCGLDGFMLCILKTEIV